MKCSRQLRPVPITACACLLWAVLALVSSADDPPRAFVFLAVDSDRADLQDHVERDRDNLQKIFKDAFEKRSGRLELTVIPQREMNAAAISKLLTDLKMTGEVRRVDTVFFYYSGHGAMAGKEHILRLRAGDLARRKIKQLLQDMDAHNTILITDCCSDPLPIHFLGVPLPKLPIAEWPVLDGLLFQHQGFTDINSCQSGTKAWNYVDDRGIHRGGVFTIALAKLLCAKPSELSPDNELVGWPDFIGHLSIATNENFQLLKKGKPNITNLTQRRQTPQIYSLATIKPRRQVDRSWRFGALAAPLKNAGKLVVAEIAPGSPAARYGVRPGDILESINDAPIQTTAEYVQAISNSGGDIDLSIIRDNRRVTLPGIALELERPELAAPPAQP